MAYKTTTIILSVVLFVTLQAVVYLLVQRKADHEYQELLVEQAQNNREILSLLTRCYGQQERFVEAYRSTLHGMVENLGIAPSWPIMAMLNAAPYGLGGPEDGGTDERLPQ